MTDSAQGSLYAGAFSPFRSPARSERAYGPLATHAMRHASCFDAFQRAGHASRGATHHEERPIARPWAFAQAAGLFGVGLLLNRLPVRPSAFELIPTRPEEWAKMAVGVGVVNRLNAGVRQAPPPWVQGLETVGVMTLMTQGLSKKGWKHFPLLAISVPALVQATQWASERAVEALSEAGSAVPSWATHIGVAFASTMAGLVGLRSVMKANWYRAATGRLSGESAHNPMVGAQAIACSRCGGAHLVCMEELSDMLAGMAAWAQDHLTQRDRAAHV